MTLQPPPLQQPPQPDAPLFTSHEVHVFRDRVVTKLGTYAAHAIDGVEFGHASVPTRKIVMDVMWAVTWGVLWMAFISASQWPMAICGVLVIDRILWWWAEQKHAAAILVRGVRVQVALGTEADMRRIANAVLQIMGRS